LCVEEFVFLREVGFCGGFPGIGFCRKVELAHEFGGVVEVIGWRRGIIAEEFVAGRLEAHFGKWGFKIDLLNLVEEFGGGFFLF
jgi:hypothetical protein